MYECVECGVDVECDCEWCEEYDCLVGGDFVEVVMLEYGGDEWE